MSKSYAIDESSFNPASKGRGPGAGAPRSSSASSRSTIPAQDVPEELREVFKKYPNLPAVLKSNDPGVLAQVVGFLKTRPDFNAAEELSLHLAQGAGSLSVPMARALIEQGATLGALHEKMDAVFVAAEGKNDALVMFFVQEGHVPADHVRSGGVSLLMVALRQESYGLAEQLLTAGANIDHATSRMGGQHTALHYAAAGGSFQGVIWLIERGANASQANLDNKWPCELVPATDEQSKVWDMDCMYEALKDYGYQCEQARQQDPTAKVAYEISTRLREMAYLESTPMTQMEAMVEAMSQQQGPAQPQNEVEGLLPKKGKKLGF